MPRHFATVRWLLALNSTIIAYGNPDESTLHIRGLCNAPERLLCVQLSDGRIFLYEMQKLLSEFVPSCTRLDMYHIFDFLRPDNVRWDFMCFISW